MGGEGGRPPGKFRELKDKGDLWAPSLVLNNCQNKMIFKLEKH